MGVVYWYWGYHHTQKDIWSEGYVGISRDKETRVTAHQKSAEWANSEIQSLTVYSGPIECCWEIAIITRWVHINCHPKRKKMPMEEKMPVFKTVPIPTRYLGDGLGEKILEIIDEVEAEMDLVREGVATRKALQDHQRNPKTSAIPISTIYLNDDTIEQLIKAMQDDEDPEAQEARRLLQEELSNRGHDVIELK